VRFQSSLGEIVVEANGNSRKGAQKLASSMAVSQLSPPKKQEVFQLSFKDILCLSNCIRRFVDSSMDDGLNPLDDLAFIDDDNEAAARLAQMFKEGSFNPYGNGMIMTKEQFLNKHKARFDAQNLTKKERSQRYQAYASASMRVKSKPRQRRPKQSMVEYPTRQIAQQNSALRDQNLREQDRFRNTMDRNRRSNRITVNSFSRCALLYAQALIDPWGVESPPCVPDDVTLPSWKFGSRIRANFQVGSMSCGYVIANPYQVCGDVAALYYSGAGFNVATFNGITYGTGNVAGTTDSPLATANFNANGNSYRVVGSGLACRYVGNEMNRGGQMLLYRDNQNNTIPGITQTQLLANKETTTIPIDREWHYVVWKPASATDTNYNQTLPLITGAGFCLMVVVYGAVTNLSFEFDFITWYEVVGRDLANLTQSENDPNGLAVIRSASAVPQPPDSPKDNFSRFMGNLAEIANETLSFVGTGVKALNTGANVLANIGLL